MEFYLAPMEGVGGYIFRQAIMDNFGKGVSKAFTPFLMPYTKRAMTNRELKEILPENNRGYYLVPQILTTDADDFLRLEKEICSYGYKEINLNLGCPSATVASKGRGAGFLRFPDKLDEFLYRVYEGCISTLSVKTRIGVEDPKEFEKIMEIYNKYPISELIIHPRVRREMYNGKPHVDVFKQAINSSELPICYNGDICSKEDYVNLMKYLGAVNADSIDEIRDDMANGLDDEDGSIDISCGLERLDDCRITNKVMSTRLPHAVMPTRLPHAVMIGRGMIKNPALVRMLQGGDSARREEIEKYLCQLLDAYRSTNCGETPVLFKMKETWSYLRDMFSDTDKYPEGEKLIKKMLKSGTIAEYKIYEKQILSLMEL